MKNWKLEFHKFDIQVVSFLDVQFGGVLQLGGKNVIQENFRLGIRD